MKNNYKLSKNIFIKQKRGRVNTIWLENPSFRDIYQHCNFTAEFVSIEVSHKRYDTLLRVLKMLGLKLVYMCSKTVSAYANDLVLIVVDEQDKPFDPNMSSAQRSLIVSTHELRGTKSPDGYDLNYLDYTAAKILKSLSDSTLEWHRTETKVDTVLTSRIIVVAYRLHVPKFKKIEELEFELTSSGVDHIPYDQVAF